MPGLHVLMTADAVGGVWQYALDLTRGLTERGATVTLAVLGPEPDSEKSRAAGAIEGCRVAVTRLPLDWMAGSAREVTDSSEELASLAAFTGADVVHLHSAALAATGEFTAPTVAVCHSCVSTWWNAVGTGPLPDEFGWQRDLMAAGLRKADALLAPTAAFADVTARAYGLQSAPAVVPNGRRSRPPSPDLDAAPFVFTAGRLWDRAKNVATLDRVAARLSVPVLAAGALQGPNGDSVRVEAIHTLGQLADAAVGAQLDRWPIFVSLARFEPFGLAVLEAAQAGCPLVLADIPTFRELWDGAAHFVPADDDGAIAAAIDRLAADGEARRRLGAAASQRSARYTVGAMTEGVLAVYRSLGSDRDASAMVAA